MNTTISFRGFLLDVEFEYTPPLKGRLERGTGLAIEPDEEAAIELHRVFVGKKNWSGLKIFGEINIVELIPELWDKIETAIGEQYHE